MVRPEVPALLKAEYLKFQTLGGIGSMHCCFVLAAWEYSFHYTI